MKKIIFSIVIIFLFVNESYGQADPCSGVQNNYEFNICVGNTLTRLYACTDDPTQWAAQYSAQHHNIDIHPIRWQSGSTINLCWDESALVAGSPGCIDGPALSQCIEDAMCQWNKVCKSGEIDLQSTSITNPANGCCTKIDYTTNLADLELQSNAGTMDIVNTSAHTLITVQHCPGGYIICDYRNKISLNNTATYRSAYLRAYPCNPVPPGCTNPNKLRINNPCTDIFHEIGHLLGLVHTDLALPNYPACPNGASQNDVMISITNYSPCVTKTTLSQLDKCLAANLYCKGNHTSNIPKNRPLDITCTREKIRKPILTSTLPFLQVYPNPASKAITVKINATEHGVEGKFKLAIYSILGNKVYSEMFDSEKLSLNSSIDVSKYEEGAYILEYQDDSYFSERLFYVVK